MGPKHKGFPMTQSIHFDQERKKGFGSYTYQRPTVNSNLYRLFENLLGLILQAEAQKLYIYKNGWGLHLKGCPKVFEYEHVMINKQH